MTGELTLEQKRALALANARRRAAEAQRAPSTAPSAATGDVVRDEGGNPLMIAPPRPAAPGAPAAPAAPATPRTWGDAAVGYASAAADGVRQGVTSLLGAPVDIINNAPRLANLMPGVDGVGPINEDPLLGSASIDRGLRTASAPFAMATDALLGSGTGTKGVTMDGGTFGLPAVADYAPQTAGERIVNRVGQEIGASAVPVAGAIGKAATMPVQTVNRMVSAPQSVGQGVAGMFLQPAAVNPAGLAGREAAYAAGAGLGAGVANEMAGENQGIASDLAGSVAGAGLVGLGSAMFGGLRNLYAGATGNPQFMDDVAGQTVADRLIDSSTQMQQQYARTGRVDTDQLVNALRSPAAVETAVPGYRADIGDRTLDPGLSTFARNANGVSPGARTERLVANNAAVADRMAGLAPEGDASRLRVDVQSGVDRQIAEALSAEEAARSGFDTAAQAVQPGMTDATARGSSIRSALADAYSGAQEGVRAQYGALDSRTTLMDPAPLVETAKGVDMNLAPNDVKRFRPTEASTIQEMMPGDRAPLRDTGLVNEFNRPVFAENTPRPPATDTSVPTVPGEAIGRPGTTVPLSDITAIRTGLTDDLRAAQAAGNTQQARVLGQYVDTIDGYLDANLPPAMREALDAARAARRDVGERFERPGTALEAVLAKREGGGYAMDDSAIGPRLTPTDQGRVTDFGAAWREAGSDPRFREGLMDEVRSQVVSRGLLDKPEALGKYLSDRQIVLADFPELRANLERAGVARADLDAAAKAASETQKRLTTPGRSAPATYLKYGAEASGDAIRAVISSPKPVDAAKELLATANTPTARADLRAALWEEVKRKGVTAADDAVGQRRWNGKALRALFDDPKFSSVAEELWSDNPADLADIKTVFNALAGAEGSGRTVVGSGTAQSLSGKFDPALSSSSIASRVRSVNRGQLSPTIAVVDVLGTWLRGKSAQVQARAIDQITSAVVNNPGLAADLLEKYNPATAAARRAMITQKYGVRAATLLNILGEAENEDPVLDAVREDR